MGKFLLILSSLLLVRCAGYELGAGQRALPGGYDRVAVPMFSNKSTEVGIENYFTDALRSEFIRNRTASVTSVYDAQVIVEGTITSVIVTPGGQFSINPGNFQKNSDISSDRPKHSYTENNEVKNADNPLPFYVDFAKTYGVTVTVNLVARRVSDNQPVWKGGVASASSFQAPLIGTHGLSNSVPVYNQSAVNIAIEKMARDLMNQAHDQMTEKF